MGPVRVNFMIIKGNGGGGVVIAGMSRDVTFTEAERKGNVNI
jgi:hypothetical protein